MLESEQIREGLLEAVGFACGMKEGRGKEGSWRSCRFTEARSLVGSELVVG